MKGLFGIYHKSITEISRELSNLGYSHTLLGKLPKDYMEIKGVKEPPYKIYLVDGFGRISRFLKNSIVIVIESKENLLQSNCDKLLWPGVKLRIALKKMLKLPFDKKIELIISPPTLSQVIETATSYSFLNTLQAVIYKITPYTFKKKVQQAVISYFYGSLPKLRLEELLSQNEKLKELKDKCFSKEGSNFKNAIKLYHKTLDEKKVSEITGFATFEILYVIKSHEKEVEIMEKIRQGIPIPKAGRKPKKVSPLLQKLKNRKSPKLYGKNAE